jgi:three-Cys-motif partner protein
MDGPEMTEGVIGEGTEPTETPPHIKQVSRIKHAILDKYLPVWARILGSSNQRLCYFDCYAGRGEYEFGGQRVAGSALIAVRTASGYVTRNPSRLMTVVLIEKGAKELDALQGYLEQLRPYPCGLQVHVARADSTTLIGEILEHVNDLAPSFFLIDPYGHPLTIPLINEILDRERTEALINLMWYRINMDLGNPSVHHLLDNLFGDDSWRVQPFMTERGKEREKHFLEFFSSRLHADFVMPFRIRFDPEDRIWGHRTKYYLLHLSNHSKAALLMKEVMWPLGDQDGTFDFSGEAQGVLISKTPKESELENILLRQFSGQKVAFNSILEITWSLPFVEKHYRHIIKEMESRGTVNVTRITSKKTGLKDQDLVEFP